MFIWAIPPIARRISDCLNYGVLLYSENTFYLCATHLQDGRDFEMAETSFSVEEGSNVVSVCGADVS